MVSCVNLDPARILGIKTYFVLLFYESWINTYVTYATFEWKKTDERENTYQNKIVYTYTFQG